jgi:acrylyl-CoA reductase (NADPH)
MLHAILIRKDDKGDRAEHATLSDDQLPPGDVTVEVDFSTLNYKDGLAITGKAPVVRVFPLVPGIDFAGTVQESRHPGFQPGDRVVLNGWGVGEQHWGGLAQKARVKGEWLIPLPPQFTTRQAMGIGTAGYTAMLCVMALQRHGIRPESGDVLVTGASGGVGSFAVVLLKKLGFRVLAATGKSADPDYLKRLGADEILDRETLSQPGKPLQKERWAAAIDTVGSHTLANVCAATRADGAVAACGNAQGMDFPSSVAPFILRGVSLLGINSVTRPTAERLEAWGQLARLLDPGVFDSITRVIGLREAVPEAAALLEGKLRGRVIVDVNR